MLRKGLLGVARCGRKTERGTVGSANRKRRSFARCEKTEMEVRGRSGGERGCSKKRRSASAGTAEVCSRSRWFAGYGRKAKMEIVGSANRKRRSFTRCEKTEREFGGRSGASAGGHSAQALGVTRPGRGKTSGNRFPGRSRGWGDPAPAGGLPAVGD